MKLIKTEIGYELYNHGLLEGSTDHALIDRLNKEEQIDLKKLSIENCVEISGELKYNRFAAEKIYSKEDVELAIYMAQHSIEKYTNEQIFDALNSPDAIEVDFAAELNISRRRVEKALEDKSYCVISYKKDENGCFILMRN